MCTQRVLRAVHLPLLRLPRIPVFSGCLFPVSVSVEGGSRTGPCPLDVCPSPVSSSFLSRLEQTWARVMTKGLGLYPDTTSFSEGKDKREGTQEPKSFFFLSLFCDWSRVYGRKGEQGLETSVLISYEIFSFVRNGPSLLVFPTNFLGFEYSVVLPTPVYH